MRTVAGRSQPKITFRDIEGTHKKKKRKTNYKFFRADKIKIALFDMSRIDFS